MIQAKVAGNIVYELRDSTNLLRYILEVTIIPEPPVTTELSIFETRNAVLGYDIDVRDTFTSSQGDIVSLVRNGYMVETWGFKGGYVELYRKNAEGRHTHTYKITVIPKPPVQIQTYKVFTRDTIEIYFPTNVPYTSIVSSGDNIMRKIEKFSTFYRLELNMAGTYTLSFKDANNFDVAQIIIESTPQRVSYQVPKGYKVSASSLYSNYSDVSLNPAITSFSRDDTGYIMGTEL